MKERSPAMSPYLTRGRLNYYQVSLGRFKAVRVGFSSKVGKRTNFGRVTSVEDNEERAIRRCKQKLRECVLGMEEPWFFTLTFKAQYHSAFEPCRLFREWAKGKDVIAVLEKHKSGALHLHGVIDGPVYELNEYGYEYFKDWVEGFSSLSKIKNHLRASSYVCKYLSKDCVRFGKMRYYKSRGLGKVVVEKKIEKVEKKEAFYWTREEDFDIMITENKERSEIL